MFRCKGFSDLPLTNWDYNCLVMQQGGGMCVFLYQFLGGNCIFFRGTISNEWDTAGWQEIAFTDDIPTSQLITLPYYSSYYCMTTVTAPDGKRPVVTLAGASINVDDVLNVRVAFAGGNNWQIIAISDQKFSSGDTVNVVVICA